MTARRCCFWWRSIDLDWTPGDDVPIVIILHGLEGSSDSGYARDLLAAITARGWRGIVLLFRGCSGEPNRLRNSCYVKAML